MVYDNIVPYMARVCEVCGKGIMRGHKVSHAKQRTKKIFKPNLQTVRVVVDGRKRKMKVCTKCLRTLKKSQGQKG